MGLSTLRLAMGAGLVVSIASGLPTNYIANSAKTVDVTLARCSNTTGLPVTHCFMNQPATTLKLNNHVVDIKVPNSKDTINIADINNLAASSHLTFEEILASIAPQVETKHSKTLDPRFEAPARDADGNIIVGVADGQFTQTEQQREKLTEEEQKEKDAEDQIRQIEENRKEGDKYGDGEFTATDTQRKQLDDKEQKEIDALNKKIADYEKNKAEEEANAIQERKLKDPNRDDEGHIIVGAGDGKFTQTDEQRKILTEEEQKEKDAEDKIEQIEKNRENGEPYGDTEFTQNDEERKKLSDKEDKEIEALKKKIAEYEEKKKELEADGMQG